VVIVVMEQKVPDGGQDPVDEALKNTAAVGHEGPTVLVQRNNDAGKQTT